MFKDLQTKNQLNKGGVKNDKQRANFRFIL